MSGGHDAHGHDDHAPKSSGGGPSHSVTKGVAGVFVGMFDKIINGPFAGGGGHDSHGGH